MTHLQFTHTVPLSILRLEDVVGNNKSKEHGTVFPACHKWAVEVLALKQLLRLVAEVGQAALRKAEGCCQAVGTS